MDVGSAYVVINDVLRAFGLPCDPTDATFFVVYSFCVSRELLGFESTVPSSDGVNESDRFSHLRIAAHVTLALFKDSVPS